MTGSTLQLVNGVCLLATCARLSMHEDCKSVADNSTLCRFFGARICYGGIMTARLWPLLEDARISSAMRWGFRLANLALCGLSPIRVN